MLKKCSHYVLFRLHFLFKLGAKCAQILCTFYAILVVRNMLRFRARFMQTWWCEECSDFVHVLCKFGGAKYSQILSPFYTNLLLPNTECIGQQPVSKLMFKLFVSSFMRKKIMRRDLSPIALVYL